MPPASPLSLPPLPVTTGAPLAARIGRLILLTWLVLVASATTGPSTVSAAAPGTADGPTLPVGDDLSLNSLAAAAAISLQIMSRRDGNTRYQLCGREYTLARLQQAQEQLLAAVRQAATGEELIAFIEEHFLFCRTAGSQYAGKAFLTGYYEPELAGSMEPDERFRYPLYAPPPDLVRHEGREGRWAEGQFVPYWSRAEIEKYHLLAGHELAYLDDPLAAFILHVQGSGRIRLPDGTVRSIQYAARSGREYRSIGRLLLDEGRLTREEADLPGIKSYLRQHPEELRRVLHHNESYIFFRWGKEDEPGPLGSFGLPLTPGRSLALDQNYYPPGIPAYLAGVRPELNDEEKIVEWRDFSRLVFNQDSGSAIRGRGRADLFWGHDRYAAFAAGVTRHPVELFLLLPRSEMLLSDPAL
ncbi:murein transglycosylase A [Desulfurivibrio dismutans]|uniref:murein transglycosylase A n=1 Tax=Desulfurivibrio dismutans TaxID=1398908 RepID=UPI0023DA1F43|nr:MltA domain-containing protein [Desulfurivibrio alkaliphilus]MDF1615438.1 MltA domain-containing protein [Desulfurivibrio alkaliphilus]